MLRQLLSALLLFLCRHVKGMLLLLFLEKIRNVSEVHFIRSINSVRNLVVTLTNLLKKHQIKNFCFPLFTFNQSKIQIETIEHYRHSEEHLVHHL